ncbi:MAG: IS256 family transposase [Solirubrobacteraceae bacterium]
MKTVVQEQDAGELGLPASVQEALGELVADAREGLLALCVGVGLGVMHELMELEISEIVGPKGRHNPDRLAVRHGYEDGEVTLGGRRVPVRRPRARTADGAREVEVSTYAQFASRDLLAGVIFEQLAAGVSTRRFSRTREPVGDRAGQRERSVSKSAVSRAFVSRTRDQLKALMCRDLSDLRIAGLMIDGVDLKGRTNVVALGITTEGEKLALGLWEGSTENATVAQALLSDLVARGLDTEQGVLVIIDGAKALSKAVRTVLGEHCPVQRCIRHKERNVLDHLPQEDRPAVKRRLNAAWRQATHSAARRQLTVLADELAHTHPGASNSLREGLEETITIQRLGVRGDLRQTLQSTNPCESMIECVRRTSSNVKHWKNGDMAMRWTAAGMLEAEQNFKRIKGHADIAELAVEIERRVARAITAAGTPPAPATPAKETATLATT